MKPTKVVFSITYISPEDYAARGVARVANDINEPLGLTEFDFSEFTPREVAGLLIGGLLEVLSRVDHGQRIAAAISEVFADPLDESSVEVVVVKPHTN